MGCRVSRPSAAASRGGHACAAALWPDGLMILALGCAHKSGRRQRFEQGQFRNCQLPALGRLSRLVHPVPPNSLGSLVAGSSHPLVNIDDIRLLGLEVAGLARDRAKGGEKTGGGMNGGPPACRAA